MSLKTRTYCLAVVAGLFLIGASRATAAIQINMGDLVKGTLTQSTSLMGTGGTLLTLDNSEHWNSSQGGLLGWTHVTINGHPAPNFNTACIEVVQNVYWGGEATWKAVDLATAPRPNAANGLASGMGTGVASALQSLYREHFADAEISSPNAGAYQIAIWKLVYDGIGVLANPDFSSGRLVATDSPEVVLAKTWLGGLSVIPGLDGVALSSYDFQDQFSGSTPEPTSLAIWSLITGGMAGLTWIRRRRAMG